MWIIINVLYHECDQIAKSSIEITYSTKKLIHEKLFMAHASVILVNTPQFCLVLSGISQLLSFVSICFILDCTK